MTASKNYASLSEQHSHHSRITVAKSGSDQRSAIIVLNLAQEDYLGVYKPICGRGRPASQRALGGEASPIRMLAGTESLSS